MIRALSIHQSVQIFLSRLLFLILTVHQHLMYLLDLKTVDKVVCRRENSSVQPKFGHEELGKILPCLARLNSLAESIPALLSNHILDFTLVFDRYFYNDSNDIQCMSIEFPPFVFSYLRL